jgi:hypothetical protein
MDTPKEKQTPSPKTPEQELLAIILNKVIGMQFHVHHVLEHLNAIEFAINAKREHEATCHAKEKTGSCRCWTKPDTK